MSDYLRFLTLLRNDPDKVPVLVEAAERGEVDAQYALGLVYAEGRGVKIDLCLAHYWLSRAIDQGDRDAVPLRQRVGVEMSEAEFQRSMKMLKDSYGVH